MSTLSPPWWLLLAVTVVSGGRAAPLRAEVQLWDGLTDRGRVVSVEAARFAFTNAGGTVEVLLDRVAEVVFEKHWWIGEPPVPTSIVDLDGNRHAGVAEPQLSQLRLELDGSETVYELLEVRRIRLQGGQPRPVIGEARWRDGTTRPVSGAPLCHLNYLNGLGDLPANVALAAQAAYGVQDLRGLAALPCHGTMLFVPLAALDGITVADGALSARFVTGESLMLSTLAELASDQATVETPLGRLRTALETLAEIRFQPSPPVTLGGLMARDRGRAMLRSVDRSGAVLDWWEVELLTATTWRTRLGARSSDQGIVTVILVPYEFSPEYERWRALPVVGDQGIELVRFDDLAQLAVSRDADRLAGAIGLGCPLDLVRRDGEGLAVNLPPPDVGRTTAFAAFVGVVEVPGIGLLGAVLPLDNADRFDALP